MRNKATTPIVLAIIGFGAIMVGVHQGLVHVAPGYTGTIMSGWAGELNHQEVLLTGVGTIGIGGIVAARRCKPLSIVPVGAGGVILFYAFRAIARTAQKTTLYAETTLYDGSPVVFVLGAEPFLLIAGGLCLIASGVQAWRHQTGKSGQQDARAPSSTA